LEYQTVKSDKLVTVRIRANQATRLREITDYVPGSSINGWVQRAVEQLLEIEGPVYLAALREVHQKLSSKRQAVISISQ
jgi:hypothetical protein